VVLATTAFKLGEKTSDPLEMYLSDIYYLAVKDLTLPSSDANLDPQYVAIAKQHFDRLVQTYPYDVGVLVLAAKYQKKLGLTADYISTTERIRLLRPDLLEWALN
jgi:hypothetical protein